MTSYGPEFFRRYADLVEAPDLKSQAVAAVRATDDARLLQKVIDTLSAGNIEDRIAEVIGKDPDAKRFLQQIADTIIKIKAPIEEKNKFIEAYPRGILNTSKLLDGGRHSFAELVGSSFNVELFKILSVSLAEHGVGPGEVALAVFSPDISWSGRAVGGGDVQIGSEAVEVKTTRKSGGRWINARKANLDMAGIGKAIVDAIVKSTGKKPEGPLPDRINPAAWVNHIRPLIDKKILKDTVRVMADGLFSHCDNTPYQRALATGTVADIQEAILSVGYENYKNYSNFDGMLLMDIRYETAQYFRDYSDMRGQIKPDTMYVYCPESEAMPKVELTRGGGAASVAGGTTAQPSAPEEPIAAPPEITGKRVSARPTRTEKPEAGGIGRERR